MRVIIKTCVQMSFSELIDLREEGFYITSSDSEELLSSSAMKVMIPPKCEWVMKRALCEMALLINPLTSLYV